MVKSIEFKELAMLILKNNLVMKYFKIDQNGIKHKNKVNLIKCNAILKVLKDLKNKTSKKDQTGLNRIKID